MDFTDLVGARYTKMLLVLYFSVSIRIHKFTEYKDCISSIHCYAFFSAVLFLFTNQYDGVTRKGYHSSAALLCLGKDGMFVYKDNAIFVAFCPWIRLEK